MNRFAVFGNPISHSLSPMIHNEFSNELGIDMSYEKILSPIDEFEFTANQFINDGGLGFNITLPFKVEAFNFSQELTSNASAAGAVNTIKISSITNFRTPGRPPWRSMLAAACSAADIDVEPAADGWELSLQWHG